MSGRLSIRVAILNASCASLKIWDEEWMFFWIDSRTVSSLRLSPITDRSRNSLDGAQASFTPFFLCICKRECTFGGSEHGGGQLTLLRLYVAEGEPARVAVGNYRHNVVRSGEITRRGRGLQHGQPGVKQEEKQWSPNFTVFQIFQIKSPRQSGSGFTNHQYQSK